MHTHGVLQEFTLVGYDDSMKLGVHICISIVYTSVVQLFEF
jgi:hypothetical protein